MASKTLSQHCVVSGYADGGLLHCRSEVQAEFLLKVIRQRFAQCGLELHPVKTNQDCLL